MTEDGSLSLGEAEVDLTLAELGVLLDEGGSSSNPLMSRFGLKQNDAETAANAVASLALRGLSRFSRDGIYFAPPLVEARRIMLSAVSMTTVTATSTDLVWALVVFDGPDGRLSITPGAIPTCRSLTKLTTIDAVEVAVSRAVASVIPPLADVTVIMEVQREGKTASAAIRRRSGEVEVASSVDTQLPLSAADAEVQELLSRLGSDLRKYVSDRR